MAAASLQKMAGIMSTWGLTQWAPPQHGKKEDHGVWSPGDEPDTGSHRADFQQFLFSLEKKKYYTEKITKNSYGKVLHLIFINMY